VDRYPNNLPINEQRYRRVEILNGPERRRRWSLEEKARIVAESFGPGVVTSAVARRHGVHPNQLYAWRRELANSATGATLPDFVPVSVGSTACAPSVTIEIFLSGTLVRTLPGTDLNFLADVLRVVRALA